MMRRAILAGVAATVAPLALAGGLSAGHAAPRPAQCQRPALLANGQYSSYRTGGRMPSGAVVRLSDGDWWACRAGRVTVTSTRENGS